MPPSAGSARAGAAGESPAPGRRWIKRPEFFDILGKSFLKEIPYGKAHPVVGFSFLVGNTFVSGCLVFTAFGLV